MRLHPIVFVLLLVAACKSDAEKLVDLRTDLRTTMDELYAAYGGSDLANQARAQAGEPDGPGGPDGAPGIGARLMGEMDRSYFEQYCLARGRGERPFSLSGKLETFMKEPAHEKACRDAARLATRIAELQAKTAAPR